MIISGILNNPSAGSAGPGSEENRTLPLSSSPARPTENTTSTQTASSSSRVQLEDAPVRRRNLLPTSSPEPALSPELEPYRWMRFRTTSGRSVNEGGDESREPANVYRSASSGGTRANTVEDTGSSVNVGRSGIPDLTDDGQRTMERSGGEIGGEDGEQDTGGDFNAFLRARRVERGRSGRGFTERLRQRRGEGGEFGDRLRRRRSSISDRGPRRRVAERGARGGDVRGKDRERRHK